MTMTPSVSFDALVSLARQDDGRFIGHLPTKGWRRPFGGYLLAQLVTAASATLDGDRLPHSLQAQFVRAGRVGDPFEYQVESSGDGRRFSSRRVTARQGRRVLVEALVSFQEPATGFDYHRAAPEAPGPDGLRSEASLREDVLQRDDVKWFVSPAFADVPVEMRPVQARNFIDPQPTAPRLDFWMRPLQPIAPANRRAFVACLSDTMLLATTILPHGVTWMTTPMEGVTLNHSLWFHEEPSFDDWVLWSIDGLWTGGTRGLARGSLWTRDGRLIATAMQEGLVRLR